MTSDFAAVLRRRKPDKHRRQLVQRAKSDLVNAADLGPGRPILMADTTLYIDEAAGRLPPEAEDLVDRSILFHCTVCLAEIATGVANADPSKQGWTGIRDHYARLMATIPDSRLRTPDEDTWLDAGLLAGSLARTQSLQKHQRKEMLNDALIFLTAVQAGVPVLTANWTDFGLLQQLVPQGQFFYYEPRDGLVR